MIPILVFFNSLSYHFPSTKILSLILFFIFHLSLIPLSLLYLILLLLYLLYIEGLSGPYKLPRDQALLDLVSGSYDLVLSGLVSIILAESSILHARTTA